MGSGPATSFKHIQGIYIVTKHRNDYWVWAYLASGLICLFYACGKVENEKIIKANKGGNAVQKTRNRRTNIFWPQKVKWQDS